MQPRHCRLISTLDWIGAEARLGQPATATRSPGTTAWTARRARSACARSGTWRPSPGPAGSGKLRTIVEKLLFHANALGLYAVQIGASGEALGNFPQAFTHLALISAAVNLDRALDHR